MGVYRTAQGSPVVFLQEPRRLTIYMTAVSRRRRLLILIIICSLLLIIFGWYSRTWDDLSNLSENSSPGNDIYELQRNFWGINRFQHVSQPVGPERQNEFMNFLNDEKISARRYGEEYVSDPAKYDDIPLTKSYRQKPVDEKLFPGPNDYDGDIPITFPARRHPDLELKFSLRTEIEAPVTSPIRRYPVTKQKFSDVTEEDLVDGATHVTPSMHGNEMEGSTTLCRSQVPQPAKDTSLLIDTPGCQIPKLNPWDPMIRHLIELQEPYECPGPPLFMRPCSDGSITLNETILEFYYGMKPQELRCYYQPIYRKHEDPGKVREDDFARGEVTELHFGVPLNEDYVGTMCVLKDRNFDQYFPLVRLKAEVEKVRSSIAPPIPRLNVILAGIDSISKLNFFRHFRKTEAFMKVKLNMFEMNGYTKVGDNTFPNLVPMLTGRFVEHYFNDSLRDTMFFDDVDFIWKDYVKKGYRTFYAEDSPYTGTFNYLKRGFYDPPTDYYIRPLYLALESSNLRDRTGNEFCFNSQLEPEIIYDYLRNFIEAMGNRPYHAFAMVSTITHDYLNYAGWEDQPTFHLLEDLLNMGALNNSLLVLFSDHGLRYGEIRSTYIGKLEERMPFMYIHAPKWFLDQYPQYAKNLAINQNRLMTLFDIHATMLHLLDLNRSPEERAELSLGRSLLEEISPNRTCEEANILPHYCPCQTFESVPLNSPEVINASQAIVDDINFNLTEHSDVCEILEVAEIKDARIGQANDLASRLVKPQNVGVDRTVVMEDRMSPVRNYMITVITKPGHAVFEGTVRHDPEKNFYTVLGVSRISLYGQTSWCVHKQRMKLFCYCKIQTPS